jgi:hypothetical protein
MDRSEPAESQVDYAGLLNWDEESLFRNLSDPHGHEALPRRRVVFRQHASSDSSSLDFSSTPEMASFSWHRIPREPRRHRIEEHRRTARELLSLAEQEQDPARREKYERAAQLHESIAQTLETVASASLDESPTPHERRIASEDQLSELEAVHDRVMGRRRLWPSQEHRDAQKKFAQRMQCLRQEIEQLKVEEKQAAERSRNEWAALEEAKRMVAEADGRAKFNKLVPDIRTRLCAQWHACEQVKRYEDETALTMAIGDVLMTLSSTLPVATLAVLVVKIGVKKFCNCPA